jgi:tetratricopeptide (TPR) repeat protein
LLKEIQQAPNQPKFHTLAGRIYMETDRLERAIESLATAIEVDPSYAEAHYYSGIVYERWSDDELAFENYYRAYELQSDQLQFLMAAAESLVALGELEQAETMILDKMRYFEHDPAMPHLLGQIAMLQNDPGKATQYLTEARVLSPDDVSLLEELAWAQYDAGEFGACLESVSLVQSQVESDRNDLEHLAARCEVMLGRTRDAHGRYLELTRTADSDPTVWIEFGTLAWELEDYRRLAQCSVRAISLAPDRYEGYMLKGLYERQQGRTEDAINQFELASELAQGDVVPLLLLGRTQEEAGNPEAALATYGLAMQLDPASNEARVLHSRLAETMRVATAE